MTLAAWEWLDQFFEHYYRCRPVTATFSGVHLYDARLPDYSLAGIEAMASEMQGLLDRGVGPPTDRFEEVDLLLARSYLQQQLWELSSGHFQRGNPCFYTGEAIFGVVSLLLRDSAALEDRVDAAIHRCAAIPTLLDEARVNVTSAPLAWIERAIDECVGAEKLFDRGIHHVRAPDPPREELRQAGRDAAMAFHSFREHLTRMAGDSATEEYGVGSDAFDRLMREGHFLDMSGDEIVGYAEEQLEAAHNRLIDATQELVASSDPRDLLDAIADRHPRADEYDAAFPAMWERARQHAVEHDLVTWPEFPIAFEPIPMWGREAAPHLYFLYYRSPPPHDDGVTQRYLVPPLDLSWSTGQQERLLRSVNDSQITLNHIVHHAGIGHHVQNWYAHRSPSRVGRMAATDGALRIAMFQAGTLAEGWSCYVTELMDEVGYLTPLESASLHHSRMRMAARAIVDVRLHQRRFSIDDASRFYQEHALMPGGAARAEAVKNSMFPGSAMMYLVGTDLVHQLRAGIGEAPSSGFSLRRFHDAFLSYGSIPVTLIGRLMRDEPLAADRLR